MAGQLVPRATVVPIYADDKDALARLKRAGENWLEFFHRVAAMIVEELGKVPGPREES